MERQHISPEKIARQTALILDYFEIPVVEGFAEFSQEKIVTPAEVSQKKIITPSEAAEKMRKLVEYFGYDKEKCQIEMSELILAILRQLGYAEVADIFVNTWYARW